MANYALIDENNKVVTVVVAEKEYINSGALGDPATWIEDTIEIYGNAGIGMNWDPINRAFIQDKPYPSFTLNSMFEWEPPVAHPGDGNVYRWNEELITWVEYNG